MSQPRTFRNPILPGFYPDPSICRVGEDYYLVTSSFEYFPGLPIFHSRDLVNWQQLGHVLTRPSQLNLDGVRGSGGLYAPTIRHHNGLFYVINTLMGGTETHGNFIVTAPEITGPWSEPFWLPEARGIDPSLYFDDETGKAWYVGNRHVAEPQFAGHCEIWLQELDLATMHLTGPDYALWEGALKNAIWPEGPHIYKIGDYFYLLISEAGTGHDHALSIARSESITGPYEGYKRNPILTHRHLGWDYPIVGVGHADLVETQNTENSEWWLVLLGMRPTDGYHFNLGRETFLAPVTWEQGWPVVSVGVGRVEFELTAPNLPEHPWPLVPTRDNFDSETLANLWNFIRTPREPFWSLVERRGYLRLALRPIRITEVTNPSFVGRRQQHFCFVAQTALEFTPQSEQECAGLVVLQNNNFHYRLTVTLEAGSRVVQLIQREKGEETLLATQAIPEGRVYLKASATSQAAYHFFLSTDGNNWQQLSEKVDGRILSTKVAGGYVGTYIGMYASSNDQPSQNHADFDWFEYTEES